MKQNNRQIDNPQHLDVVMLMYYLIECSDKYSKSSGSLWQYYRDELALIDANIIDNFLGNSALFKFKEKITGQTGNNETKHVEIMVPLTYLLKFCRTLEMSLINC